MWNIVSISLLVCLVLVLIVACIYIRETYDYEDQAYPAFGWRYWLYTLGLVFEGLLGLALSIALVVELVSFFSPTLTLYHLSLITVHVLFLTSYFSMLKLECRIFLRRTHYYRSLKEKED